MKFHSLSKNIRVLPTLFIPICLFFVFFIYGSSRVHAMPITDFSAGNIIDDGVFYNKNSMNVQQIQAFLDNLIPNCDVWGTSPSEYGGGTRAQYAQATWGKSPPFVCINKYYENPDTGDTSFEKGGGAFSGGLSAAQIIYNAAQTYNINPQVLLVMIKKESYGPLTADSWPLKSQYKYAMGYACFDGPDGAECDASKAGFYKQMMLAAWQLNYYKEHPNDYRYHIGWNNIDYSPNISCGTKSVYVENMATLSLYIYTPYTPNSGALAAYPGEAPCGAYGNRNFYAYFKEWFGSTLSFMYGGISYSPVFDPSYYKDHNPDVKATYGDNQQALFNHFINTGVYEGRQGSANFSINSYRTAYVDLRDAYGNDIQKYLRHYIVTGEKEGRDAIGNYRGGTTTYNGIDYSSIYSFDYYTKIYPDIWNAYGLDDKKALWHFINVGVYEGRQGNTSSFNVNSYKTRYADLRDAYGNNLKMYLWHYVTTGKKEGRVATGNYRGGTTVYDGIDYGSAYSFDYYTKTYPDIWNAYGLDDKKALWHFINVGLYEGRQGSASFNVNAYRARYQDLRDAYGNNLKMYAWHYVTTGKNEGRMGT